MSSAVRDGSPLLFLLEALITNQWSLRRELTFSTGDRFTDISQDIFFFIVSRNRDRVICCCRDQLRASWRWITWFKIEAVVLLQRLLNEAN